MRVVRSREFWRAEVAAMLESGLPPTRWARERGLSQTTLATHARRIWEEEPELFAMSRALCPCPLMAKLLPYRDAQIRRYLKQVWIELWALSGASLAAGRLGYVHSAEFNVISRALAFDSTASDVGVGFLAALGDDLSWSSPGALVKPSVLAAVASGVHDGDAFFEWAAANEGAIRQFRQSGSVLKKAVGRRAFERTRVFRYRNSENSGGWTTALVVYDASTPFCIELLDGFLEARESSASLLWGDAGFFTRFEESLGFAPRGLDDFTPETFGRQIGWFDGSLHGSARSCALRLTRAFYMHVIGMLPADQQAFTFATGLPPQALGYNSVVSMWLQGYRAVVYEPLDPAPEFPKWLLYPNANEALKASFPADTPKSVDCSVGDPLLERILVEWIWDGGLGSVAVRQTPAWVRQLLGGVAERGVSVVRDGAVTPVVEARCVSAVLSRMAERNAGKHLGVIRGALRSFLEFAEGRGALDVEPACYLLLENPNCSMTSGAAPERPAVPEEHLAALAGELERMGERSVSDELTYVVFIAQALTGMRFWEVISLRVTDLDAASRDDFEAVRVRRKCGGYDCEVVQVPQEVHRLLKAAAEITEPARSRADEAIADHVFLVDGAMGRVRVLPRGTVRRRLGSACKRLGIPPIGPADVRRAYQTAVIVEGAKRNWDRMMLRPITGHARIESDEPYIVPDIMSPETRRYLEAAYVVEIGSPKVRGEVLPDEEVPGDPAALVDGGAGVCRRVDCDVLGTLPCFECRSFATAPRLIPEMVELIAAIDEQLASAPPHQREHLLPAKKRALAYLGMMMDMRDGKENRDGGTGGS